jgi:hypothetical protein
VADDKALALIDDLVNALSLHEPEIAEAFRRLHGMIVDMMDVQVALLSENAALGGRLDHQSRFVATLIDGMMNWKNSDEPIIREFVALIQESAELQQRVHDADFRHAWLSRAEKALGDRESAKQLASLIFDGALYDENVIRELMAALGAQTR